METIRINNEDWPLDYIASMVFRAKGGLNYRKANWKPRDALLTKDKRKATIYKGQEYDKNEYDLVKDYWDHDHCEICNWKFIKINPNEIIEGYFNGYNWICNECFEKVLNKNEIMTKLKKFKF
jgi:hypothetical protein